MERASWSSVRRLVEYLRSPIALLVFALVYLASHGFVTVNRLVIGWDGYALVWLAFTWYRIVTLHHDKTRDWATRGDTDRSLIERVIPGHTISFTLVILISLLGLWFATILFTYWRAIATPSNPRGLVSSAVAVVLAWLVLHTAFTVFYATRYYQNDAADREAGLIFPGREDPSLLGFAYFAFTLGTSLAASDVSISTREFRRPVLAHILLSFVYNTAILALIVNIGLSIH